VQEATNQSLLSEEEIKLDHIRQRKEEEKRKKKLEREQSLQKEEITLKNLDPTRKKDVKNNLRDEIMAKLFNKFNLDAVLKELENMKCVSFLKKLQFIGSKMQRDTMIDFNAYFKILNTVGLEIPK